MFKNSDVYPLNISVLLEACGSSKYDQSKSFFVILAPMLELMNAHCLGWLVWVTCKLVMNKEIVDTKTKKKNGNNCTLVFVWETILGGYMTCHWRRFCDQDFVRGHSIPTIIPIILGSSFWKCYLSDLIPILCGIWQKHRTHVLGFLMKKSTAINPRTNFVLFTPLD